MRREALQQYTRDPKHFGKNQIQILQKFDQYASMCKDPFNIYRYMEEKSICIFMPEYWEKRATFYYNEGDYRNCFQCIQEAISRADTLDLPLAIKIDWPTRLKHFKDDLLLDLKRTPLKSKRTVEQYNLISNETKDLIEDQTERFEKLLNIYDTKYGNLREDKKEAFIAKLEKNENSWLWEQYKKEDQEQRKVIEKSFVQNSVVVSRERKNGALHTPIKPKEEHRLTKTMNSIEMLKKRNSSLGRSKNNFKLDNDEDQNSLNIFQSVPIGKNFTQLKRRVTFDTNSKAKIQKIREGKKQSSFFKRKTAEYFINSKLEETFGKKKFEQRQIEGNQSSNTVNDQMKCSQK